MRGSVASLAAAAAALALPGGALAATGDLSYQGCISGESASAGCAQIAGATADGINSGLSGLRSPAVSADGASVYAVAANDDAVAQFGRDPATGVLTYVGCISGRIETTACTQLPAASSQGDNSGIDFPASLAISADGKSVYVGSYNDDGVVRFNRDPATGALTYAGCLTGETEVAACVKIPGAASAATDTGLDFLQDVAVSADGSSVYTVSQSDDAVARFTRDPATGALTFAGCISGKTEAACVHIPAAASGGAKSGLDNINYLAVSGDGKSLYTGSNDDSAIAGFNRDPASGALTYASCITGATQTTGCAPIPGATADGSNSGFYRLGAIDVSADGRSVYAAASNDAAIARFDRDPATGALTYAGCVSGETASSGCAQIPGATPSGTNSGLYMPLSIAASADGRSVYVGARGDDAIARFDRDPAGGGLAYGGCISGAVESAGCAQIPGAAAMGANSGLGSINGTALSADGRSLYSGSGGDAALARFDRVPEPPAPVPVVPAPVALELTAKKKQEGFKAVRVSASCELACTVTAGGTIKLPAGAGKARLKLKPASAELAAAETTTLKLKLKGKTRRLTKAALAAGGRAKATISATASDGVGSPDSATLKVKLKSK
jgi:6-phosphogluconolactonase (cycloisomerase 2 family)